MSNLAKQEIARGGGLLLFVWLVGVAVRLDPAWPVRCFRRQAR